MCLEEWHEHVLAGMFVADWFVLGTAPSHVLTPPPPPIRMIRWPGDYIYMMIILAIISSLQGTASVILSGLLTSCRATGRRLRDENIVCFGAGESMIGFANLLIECLMLRSGLSRSEAKTHLWMVDSRGLIIEGRSTGGISVENCL